MGFFFFFLVRWFKSTKMVTLQGDLYKKNIHPSTFEVLTANKSLIKTNFFFFKSKRKIPSFEINLALEILLLICISSDLLNLK